MSAYAVSPLAVPAACIGLVAVVLVLTRPAYGLALALALAPFLNVAIGPASVKLLVYGLVFATLAYAVLVPAATAPARSAPRSLTIGITMFAGAALVSALFGIDPGGSVGRVVLLVVAAAAFFAVLTVGRSPSDLTVVVGGALLGLLAAGAHGLLQHLTGTGTEYSVVAGGEVEQRVQGAFGHPNEFGGYLALLIPLAVGVLFSSRFSARFRALAAAAFAVALPALFFTYSRGPVAALAAGMLLWAALRRPRLAVAVGLGVAVVALFLIPSALGERFAEGGSDVTLRSDIWRAAIVIYSDHPVTGVGPNNFADAYAGLPSELPGGVQRRLLHREQVLVPPFAENLYLHVLAEEGIVGLIALFALGAAAVLVVHRGMSTHDPAGRAVAFGVGAGIVALALHGIVQVTLFSELVLALFALLAVVGRYVTLDWERAAAAER